MKRRIYNSTLNPALWNEDGTLKQDVNQNLIQIAKDFYAKAYLSDYDLEWNAILEPWLEETESVLAGWSFVIKVQQKFDYNRCVLPISSFSPGLTWEQLDRLWKKVNEQWQNV